MFLVVGLGNPEKKYDGTYHNMGFSTLDKLSEDEDFEFNKKICNALVGEFFTDKNKVLVAKPLTYMNLSGNAVLALKTKFKIPNQNILVIVDDVDLPVGTFRYKTGGSGGTHNGMRSIVSAIGSDFPRLRIGIGKPDGVDLADFVLSKIKGENLKILTEVISEVAQIISQKVRN